MVSLIKRIIDFFKDDILRLSRFSSPLDGKNISKTQFIKEEKYLQDINTMFNTVGENILGSDAGNAEEQIQGIVDGDQKYIQIYNHIVSEGVKTLSEEELQWLKVYLVNNKDHWHNSNFHIIRRKLQTEL